ncbi:hypothetical protein NUW58_g4518 [Xylaria curta]|uniref:Uncharacterized protein n=1 Tax=Xylaria curta TaxID=42375 RepID=A0ACC1P610_9PEZI|nr:hypothetical protein NUW58_g4518 [Xylaria curta]
MYRSSITAVVAAVIVGLPLEINGQQSGWDLNQVNATMCAWKGLRAAQLKDTAYLDGGFLYWSPGLADGNVGPPENDANPFGVIYTLNFSIPFSSTTNTSLILKPITASGVAVNNLMPNYYDGALLANDHEFTLYGGLLKNSEASTPPDADAVLTYQASDYGLVKDNFHPGFLNDKLPEGLTRYVTYGGAASAPSENKAWYFGGYRSPLWGPVYQPSINGSLNPTNVSNSFITLDLAVNQSKKWANDTLPPGTPSRANPSLVWVPVGGQGILVALGGVADPNYNNPSQKSLNEGQSRLVSPGYMTNIDVYDVASGKWYQQPTIDAPPQLAMGCAVVAPARDSSSYNIYYYGG